MAIRKIQNQNTEKIRISTTGYRVLLVLKSLLQGSHTIDELVKIVQSNSYVNKSASKDTIRLDINTLKLAGCVIERPSKANNYKYKLISHPFFLELSEDEFNIFSDLRTKFAQNISVREVFILNNLYKKIFELTFNQNQIDFIENSQPLSTINREIFTQLSNDNIINKRVQITYKSAQYGEEILYIIPQKILYENDKVYLWCYNYKYENYGILYIDRILKINSVDIAEVNEEPEYKYIVIYEISVNNIDSFELKDYETVLNETPDIITIKAKVNNEFLFIQRLLQFGSAFRIISPDFFKEKMIDKVKLIQKRYGLWKCLKKIIIPEQEF